MPAWPNMVTMAILPWAASLLVVVSVPASAQDAPAARPTRKMLFSVGELTCNNGPNTVAGPQRITNMDCQFRTSFGDVKARYTAKLERDPPPPGAGNAVLFTWGIYSTQTTAGNGTLEGDYGRVRAGSNPVGFVGRFGLANSGNGQIYLQPRSVVINNDLINLAKSGTRLTLKQRS